MIVSVNITLTSCFHCRKNSVLVIQLIVNMSTIHSDNPKLFIIITGAKYRNAKKDKFYLSRARAHQLPQKLTQICSIEKLGHDE